MKTTCEYCGGSFENYLAACPHCGAPNRHVVRSAGDQPLTIDELKKWYHDHGLPPYETTRFFIGEDYRQPRAIGIYQDSQTRNYVVYMNMDTGRRRIRYEGSDEAYAVNEVFQRLKSEIIQQKNAQRKRREEQAKGGILRGLFGRRS